MLRSSTPNQLHELAKLHDLEINYLDGMGDWQVVPDTTLQVILGMMNVQTASPDDIQQALVVEREKPWTLDTTTAYSTVCIKGSCVQSHGFNSPHISKKNVAFFNTQSAS